MSLKYILLRSLLSFLILITIGCSSDPAEPEINDVIMPTVGVGDIRFQDTGSKVIDTYGAYDNITAIVSAGNALFVIWYDEAGLAFQMEKVDVGNRSLQEIVDEADMLVDPSMTLTTMVMMSPFKGATAEGIGLGTSRAKVIEAYGEPDEIGTLTEDYNDLKMSIWYNAAGDAVRRIDLFK